MKYRIYQVDSFTRNKFHGNPAGVVANADGLTEEQMQKIARELNNSETAFIISSNKKEYDVELRFFTPTTEVPSCGHATIAAHYILAHEEKKIGKFIQKTKAGLLPIEIISDNDDYSVIMTQAEPFVSKPFNKTLITKITKALGITKDDLRDDCPVAIASTGHSKIMIGIKEDSLLHSIQPNIELLKEISKQVGCNGYYVFTLHPKDKVLVHGRMFAPAIGITEDPVTGNANGPLGIYMVHFKICEELQHKDYFDFEIMQGEAINRDGSMHVHVTINNGKPEKVQITGKAVIVFQTEMEINDVEKE